MNLRQESRDYALKFLFQTDFNEEELEQAWADFWVGKRAGRRVKVFARELVDGVLDHLEDIDLSLQDVSDNWQLHRMAALDRNIMRMAVYEMTFRSDIPPVVSIHEAIRLANEYGAPESGKFVNGILDRMLKNLNRPARAADGEGG